MEVAKTSENRRYDRTLGEFGNDKTIELSFLTELSLGITEHSIRDLKIGLFPETVVSLLCNIER